MAFDILSPRVIGLYAVMGTLGSLCIVYGIRRFLWATFSWKSPYCCQPIVELQLWGLLVAVVGWGLLILAATDWYQRLDG